MTEDPKMRQVREGFSEGMKQLADYVKNVPRKNRVVDARDGDNYLEAGQYNFNNRKVTVHGFGVSDGVCNVVWYLPEQTIRVLEVLKTRQEENVDVYVTPFEPIEHSRHEKALEKAKNTLATIRE